MLGFGVSGGKRLSVRCPFEEGHKSPLHAHYELWLFILKFLSRQ